MGGEKIFYSNGSVRGLGYPTLVVQGRCCVSCCSGWGNGYYAVVVGGMGIVL